MRVATRAFSFSPSFTSVPSPKFFRNSSICFCVLNAGVFHLTFVSSATSFLSSCTRTFHDSVGIKASISFSRSTTSRIATDWTRPAESVVVLGTFLQRIGETSNPTIRSRTRRACCASTRSWSMKRGLAIACVIAFLVISWNTILFVVFVSRPIASQRCHPMASHSRSSSVAIQTFSADFASFLSSATIFFFPSSTT